MAPLRFRTSLLAIIALMLGGACAGNSEQAAPEATLAEPEQPMSYVSTASLHSSSRAQAEKQADRQRRAQAKAWQQANPDGRSTREIKRVVRARVQDVQSCYDAALRRNPRQKGKVFAEWIIEGDGSITILDMYSHTLDQGLQKCVQRIVESFEFGPAGDGKPFTVTFPFFFQPSG